MAAPHTALSAACLRSALFALASCAFIAVPAQETRQAPAATRAPGSDPALIKTTGPGTLGCRCTCEQREGGSSTVEIEMPSEGCASANGALCGTRGIVKNCLNAIVGATPVREAAAERPRTDTTSVRHPR